MRPSLLVYSTKDEQRSYIKKPEASTQHLQTRQKKQVASVEIAEALAMKEGLALVVSLGCNLIVTESDSLVTIEACMGKETWWTTPAAIYTN
jgi:hypothetical protein